MKNDDMLFLLSEHSPKDCIECAEEEATADQDEPNKDLTTESTVKKQTFGMKFNSFSNLLKKKMDQIQVPKISEKIQITMKRSTNATEIPIEQEAKQPNSQSNLNTFLNKLLTIGGQNETPKANLLRSIDPDSLVTTTNVLNISKSFFWKIINPLKQKQILWTLLKKMMKNLRFQMMS